MGKKSENKVILTMCIRDLLFHVFPLKRLFILKSVLTYFQVVLQSQLSVFIKDVYSFW